MRQNLSDSLSKTIRNLREESDPAHNYHQTIANHFFSF